jgi:hypothetical protein
MLKPSTRRPLLAAVASAIAAGPLSAGEFAAEDPWTRLAYFWNPFADRLNHGVLDLKAWKRFVQEVDRIEGRKPCSPK